MGPLVRWFLGFRLPRWGVALVWASAFVVAFLVPADAYSETGPVWIRDGGQEPPVEHLEDVPPPSPAPSPEGISIQVLAGAVASVSAEDSGVQPSALISVQAPLSTSAKGPILGVDLALTAGAGESLDLAQVETYRSVELGLSVYQPLFPSILKFGIYGQLGVASRLRGATEPAQKSPLWGSFGVGMRDKGNRYYLFLGLGGDQRISPDIAQFAMTLRGKAELPPIKDGILKGTVAALVVDLIRGLDVSQYGQGYPGRDGGTSSYRIAVMAGW